MIQAWPTYYIKYTSKNLSVPLLQCWGRIEISIGFIHINKAIKITSMYIRTIINKSTTRDTNLHTHYIIYQAIIITKNY